MIALLAAAATIAAAPPEYPPPTITVGGSCYDTVAKLRAYRQSLPDGVEAPPGPLFGCRAGKVVSIEPLPPVSHEFDADMVIKPGPDPAGCKVVQQQVKDDQKVYFERLRGRNRPGAIWLVERKVAGCGVTTPMGYHPTYLLPGAADVPPRRADAPPNRR